MYGKNTLLECVINEFWSTVTLPSYYYVHWVCPCTSQLYPVFFKSFSFWKESSMSCMYSSTCSYMTVTVFCPAHTRICQFASLFFCYIPWLFLIAWTCWKCYSSLQNVYKKNTSGVNSFHSYTDYCAQGQVCRAVPPHQNEINKKQNFNVSPCIFQFNNWQTPTHALFQIQHCISLKC
jgi:hypothetical protein